LVRKSPFSFRFPPLASARGFLNRVAAVLAKNRKPWVLCATALLAVGGMIAIPYGLWAMSFDLKQVSEMPQTSIVYDRNGQVIQRFYEQHRLRVSSEQIPDLLRKSIIAAEDQRFYWHFGFDPIAIFRAVLGNFTGARIRSGASTLTQQLARNSAGMSERTVDRKLKEVFLAMRIELNFSKEEILTFYLNRVYFGKQMYGVGAAAEAFFGKKPADLNLSECAMLAGIISGPNSFSPWNNPAKARQARLRTLERMLDQGFITKQEAEACEQQPLVLRPYLELPGSHAILAVRDELSTFLTRDDITRGGLKIYTTLDLGFQRVAENELEASLAETESPKGYRHSTRAQFLQKARDENTPTPYLQGAFVALSNRDGGVLAMVGSRNYDESPLNRALAARRQVGSTLKPFVYAQAFSGLNFTGFTLVDSTPFDLQTTVPGFVPPGDGNFIPVRQALQSSNNYCAMRTGLAAGVEGFSHLIKEATGVNVPAYPSTILGSYELTPFELCTAYTAFPNYGVIIKPYLIQRVVDASGKEIYCHTDARKRILSPQVSFQIHDLLIGVVNSGTAAGLRSRFDLKGEIAGKTGTTNDFKDSWFVGYTSEVTAVVWSGLDRPETIMDAGFASRIALPVWGRIMKQANEIYLPQKLLPPPGLQRVQRRLFFNLGVGQPEYVRDDQRAHSVARLNPFNPQDSGAAHPSSRLSWWDHLFNPSKVRAVRAGTYQSEEADDLYEATDPENNQPVARIQDAPNTQAPRAVPVRKN
jgi:penicillin-binding protein 1A